MKAMKGMNMNKMLGSLKRKRKYLQTPPRRNAPNLVLANAEEQVSDSGLDTPEANAIRNVVCVLEKLIGAQG